MHRYPASTSFGAVALTLLLSGCADERDMIGSPGGPLFPPEDDAGNDATGDADDGDSDGADDGGTGNEDGSGGPGGDDGGDDGGDNTGDDGGDTGNEGGTGDDGGDPNPNDPYDADRDRCVALINDYRATLGVAPLTRWRGSDAEACVDGQAKTDSLEYGGVHAEFGKCGERLQNEGGWAGGMYPGFEHNLDSMWGEGPGGGHYENMASPSVTEVLCGFYQSTTGQYAGWWSAVQDFR